MDKVSHEVHGIRQGLVCADRLLEVGPLEFGQWLVSKCGLLV